MAPGFKADFPRQPEKATLPKRQALPGPGGGFGQAALRLREALETGIICTQA